MSQRSKDTPEGLKARLTAAMARELMDTSPLALSLLDRELRFVAVNAAAAEINGVPVAEHAGRLLGELLPDIFSRCESTMRAAIDEDRPIFADEVNGETPRSPGVQRWWRVYWLPVHEGDAVIGLAALFHDVTIERRLGEMHESLLERQHRLAEALTQRLLPRHLPRIPGCEVATKYLAAGFESGVGGDFYDLVATGAEGWLAIVGDIAGKGPEAAAMTAVIRHTVRAVAAREHDPTACLQAANAALLQEDAITTCTAVAVRVAPGPGGYSLVSVNSGHPSPVLMRVGGQVERIDGRGPLLGLYPELNLPRQSASLARGDTLVLFTDGITDLRTPGGVLGERPLLDLLATLTNAPAREIADQIEAMAHTAQPDGARDDLAVMVIQNAGPGALDRGRT